MPNLSIATNEVAIILFIWEIVSRVPREEDIAFCINWVGGVIRLFGLRGILGPSLSAIHQQATANMRQ